MRNLGKIHPSKVFYRYVYPVFAKEFLISCVCYEDFAKLVQEVFILTPAQWQAVLIEWELKESILS